MVSWPNIQSVQVGMPRQLGVPGSDDPKEKPWFSGFVKAKVDGSVRVTFTGLVGDGQADLKNHGGPDKAILCYNAGHFSEWASEFARNDISGGMFGENFTIDNLSEKKVCIGDTFSIGDVTVQVTQPRQPCWKLGRRWNEPLLPKMIIKKGYCGWYLRVLSEGLVEAGQGFVLTDRPHPDWTVRRAHHTMYRKDISRDDRYELAELPELSNAWKQELTAKL